MDGRKRPVEGAEKHRNGKKNYQRWGKDGNRKQILYQQPAAGHRAFFKGSTAALVGRGHALALGCNV